MNGTGAPTRSYRGSPERSGDGLRTESGKKRSNVESTHYLLCFKHIRYSRNLRFGTPVAPTSDQQVLQKRYQTNISKKLPPNIETNPNMGSKRYPWEGPGGGLGTRETLGDHPPRSHQEAAQSTRAQAGELRSAGYFLGSNHERHKGSNTVSRALQRRSQNRVR